MLTRTKSLMKNQIIPVKYWIYWVFLDPNNSRSSCRFRSISMEGTMESRISDAKAALAFMFSHILLVGGAA